MPYYVGNRFPVLEKCPYCDKANIQRRSPRQATCGESPCAEKHRRAMDTARKAKYREQKRHGSL